MKLLFDENLSPKLPRILAVDFLGSMHVRDCGLKGFPDEDVWEYARNNGFTIVSKDSDFYQRSLLYGHPPKLVWLRIGLGGVANFFRVIGGVMKPLADLFHSIRFSGISSKNREGGL